MAKHIGNCTLVFSKDYSSVIKWMGFYELNLIRIVELRNEPNQGTALLLVYLGGIYPNT